MDKNGLRRQIVTNRNLLSSEERVAKNRAIVRNLLSISKVQEAKTIFSYFDFRNEVETSGIFHWGWQTGKKMAVPVTKVAEREIIPVILQSFSELQPGAYGIREPLGKMGASGQRDYDKMPIEAIDVVIVPGVAFDCQGRRLGYGGGYYDRFLPKLRRDTVKIGVAYQLQMVDEVPVEDHDIQLDFLVTEDGVIDCKEDA